MKRFLTILVVVVLCLGALIVAYIGIPSVQKFFLTAYLFFPSRYTVFEKNVHPEYPKTTFAIPTTSDYTVVVTKDAHALRVYRNGRVVKEYIVNVRRELPDRERWDDNQTPEGIFTIDSMDVVSRPPWERWMRLDTLEKGRQMYVTEYPDGATRLAAYEQSNGAVVTDADIRRFNRANDDAPMLRGIGIHGGGFSPHRDWTKGCIGMRDEDVRELFDLLATNPNGGIGTTVIVQD